jgi:hypothetical protein
LGREQVRTTRSCRLPITGATFEHGYPVYTRRLSAAEKNYSVQEKECLAIKYCLGKFKHYVLATNMSKP